MNDKTIGIIWLCLTVILMVGLIVFLDYHDAKEKLERLSCFEPIAIDFCLEKGYEYSYSKVYGYFFVCYENRQPLEFDFTSSEINKCTMRD